MGHIAVKLRPEFSTIDEQINTTYSRATNVKN